MKNSIRGWTKPGPLPVGGPPPEEQETLDPLSGHWGIYQFKKGHRYSTDDLLTAWYGVTWAPSPRRVLDLGSGIGSIAMMIAWKIPGCRITTIEAQEQSVQLAKKSIAYNGLQGIFRVIEGDLRDPSLLKAGEKFDLILACPPYWPVNSRTKAQHAQAVSARLETRGDVADYCKTVRRHLDKGAVFVMGFPFDQRPRVEAAAAQNDLGIFHLRPVLFKEAKPPSLGLWAMVRREDVPPLLWEKPWEEPPLTIRNEDGSSHREYASIKLSMGFPPW